MTHRARTPSQRASRLLAGTLAAATLFALAATAPAPASAAPPLLWEAEIGQSTPGASGVAVSPVDSHVFVADLSGNRIVELTAWGTFVRAWGWDVVESGPGDTASDEFEICVPSEGDVCQAGTSGPGVGQISLPQGVAVDSAGDVYVFELQPEGGIRPRIEKFDLSGPDPAFEWMLGGGVNQGGGSPESPGNLCTAEHIANGDVCGAGSEGAGNGEFADRLLGDYIEVDAKGTASAADDDLWVGDRERIQRFDAEGAYQGEISRPGDYIGALAIAPSGDLYAAACNPGCAASVSAEPGVHRLSPTGEELATFAVEEPRSVATDPAGSVYVTDNDSVFPNVKPTTIRKFTPAGAEVGDAEFPFQDGLGSSRGLASAAVTEAGEIALYVSNASPSFLRAYGAVPDPAVVGPPPSVPPSIVDSGAITVAFTEATLQAKINPHFWEDTSYFAQHATAACIEAQGWEAPCATSTPATALAAGVTDTPVTRTVDLNGLSPATAYRFRFVAQSSGGGPTLGEEKRFTTYRLPADNTACPNRALRNGPAAKLPDCRAYEMVSPVDKGGGEILRGDIEGFDPSLGYGGFDKSAADGQSIAYTSPAVFAGALGAPIFSNYIASRAASGWSTESLNPPLRGGITNPILWSTNQFKAFSEDLCHGWLVPESGLPLSDPGPIEGYRNLYRGQTCASPDYAWLESSGRPEPEPCPAPECSGAALSLFPDLQGATESGRCAAFRVNDALTPEAPRGLGNPEISVFQLYLWCEGQGVRLASVLPNGTPYEDTSTAGSENGPLGPRSEGAAGEGHIDTVRQALSADGTRLYWSTSAYESGTKPHRLYLRVNADQPQSAISAGKCSQPARACTLPVSEAVPTTQPAQFWTASRDGGRAIFSIKGKGSLGGNLYEYELASEGATLIAEQSLGVAGASEDASRVYLASRQVCSSAPNSEGEGAQEGAPNLYLYEAGESCEEGELDFVGALAEEEISFDSPIPSPTSRVPRRRLARATADGSRLAFVSAAQLTAYDSRDAASGQPDRQVYLYDATSGELRCASCNPSGARPRGAALGGFGRWTAAYIPGQQHQLYERRILSSDGERLFFNSVDRLVPQDVNDALDVYQWEAPGKGDCTTASPAYSAQNGGCVALISSGESPSDSEFIDASADGDDVFIRTASSLDPRDPEAYDIYDARAGGGIPIHAEPAPCEGEACQSAPPPPEAPAAASAGFKGAGNVAPPARSCRGPARRARHLARKAKRSRRAAKRAKAPARSRKLRRRAKRNAKGARRHAKRAKRCRASRKRANAKRRAQR